MPREKLIEIGKTYRDEHGRIVIIIAPDPFDEELLIGVADANKHTNWGQRYFCDGRCYGKPSLNLIVKAI